MSKSKKIEVSFEGQMERNAIINYLESLLEGLKNGVINIQHGAQQVTLHPKDVINLGMKVKQKEKKDTVSIELKWKNQPEISVVPPDISVTPPEIGADRLPQA
jgi:amphi-Trp domain-containing protein